MTNTNIIKLAQPGTFIDSLTENLRNGARVLRRALSPTFPAGELVFFIPWRVVAAIPARRISTCSGRLVGAAAGGRTMVMSPPAPISFS